MDLCSYEEDVESRGSPYEGDQSAVSPHHCELLPVFLLKIFLLVLVIFNIFATLNIPLLINHLPPFQLVSTQLFNINHFLIASLMKLISS